MVIGGRWGKHGRSRRQALGCLTLPASGHCSHRLRSKVLMRRRKSVGTVRRAGGVRRLFDRTPGAQRVACWRWKRNGAETHAAARKWQCTLLRYLLTKHAKTVPRLRAQGECCMLGCKQDMVFQSSSLPVCTEQQRLWRGVAVSDRELACWPNGSTALR